jgi:hypothetical protein
VHHVSQPIRARAWSIVPVATIILLLATTIVSSFAAPPRVSGDSDWIVTSLADDGSEGTLRYAIDNSAEGDVITFASSLHGTITLDAALGQLIVPHALTIEGPGSDRIAIDGGGETRVLFIKGPKSAYCVDSDDPSVSQDACGGSGGGCESDDTTMPGREVTTELTPDTTISGLTIRNGFPKYALPYPCIPADPQKSPHGPGCYGGNILCVRAHVALLNCVVEGGLASQGGGIAVRNAASLYAEGCTIRNNEAGPNDTEVYSGTPYSGGALDVRNESAVVLENCTISGNSSSEGGAISSYGKGQGDDTDLALISCTVSDNVVGPFVEPNAVPQPGEGCGDPFYGGGGIFAKKTALLVEDCVIDDNTAVDNEYKFAAGAGILLKRSTALVTGTTISDNVAGTGGYGGFGAGIASLNSDLRVLTCSIVDNSAGDMSDVGAGGGIYLGQGYLSTPEGELEPASSGNLFPVEIVSSLIAGNTAGSEEALMAAGGGIGMGQYEFLEHNLPRFFEPEYDEIDLSSLNSNTSTVLTNCTVSGNSAYTSGDDSSGGGIANTHPSKTMVLNFCTVTENVSSYASGLSTMLPGASGSTEVAPESGQPKLRLKNSIVAGNTSLETANEIDASMMSWEGNVLAQAMYPTTPDPESDRFDGGCGDIYTDDPLLGPLQDNGGPTLTHAPLPGSPAVDVACDCKAVALVFDENYAPGDVQELLVETDQRDRLRPVDGDGDGEPRADAGAFEAEPDIVLPDVSGKGVNAGESKVGDCVEFRVRVMNQGGAALAISDIILEGAGAFSLVGDYDGVMIEAGDSIWVRIRFCPTKAMGASATLAVFSSDPDEPIVEVVVKGTGVKERDRAVESADMSANYLLIDPQQVLPGQEVHVSANICNQGGEAGSRTATLAVNGVAEQSQSVTVSPGACQQVAFALSRAVPGTYDVSIDGMQGQFTVLAPLTVQASVPSQQDTGLGTAGLVAIIVMVIALIAALLLVFRRE